MKVGDAHLTYCTNVHPGESWPEVRAILDRYVPAVRDEVVPGERFGVGLRLSGRAAAELDDERAFAELCERLGAAGLYVFTINGFPYGPFHGTRVKEQVYQPDWTHPERLAYSNRLARLLARLLPSDEGSGMYGSISTVPGAWRDVADSPAALERMTLQLVEHVAVLHRLECDTGRTIVLALEPEPGCLLETTTDAVRLFERRLLVREARQHLARELDVDLAAAEAIVRRHLGLCLDACHAAVQGEGPAQAVERLHAAGIRIAKVQLSAGLRVPRLDRETMDALAPYAEGVYLHQVVEHGGEGPRRRWDDLPQALEAAHRGEAGGEWRIHFHVPIFADELGHFSSTRAFVEELLRLHAGSPVSPHLEVETYTWDVLPDRTDDVTAATALELQWVRRCLDA